MDGESEALHRQLHQDGCAVFTATKDHAIVDNLGVRSPGRFVERRIMVRADWRAGRITVYDDGAVIVMRVPERRDYYG